MVSMIYSLWLEGSCVEDLSPACKFSMTYCGLLSSPIQQASTQFIRACNDVKLVKFEMFDLIFCMIYIEVFCVIPNKKLFTFKIGS